VKTLSKVAAGVLATIAMLLFPALALAQDAPTAPAPAPQAAQAPGGDGGGQTAPDPDPAAAKIKVKVKGLKGGKAKVGDRVTAVATVTPFVPHQ